MAAWGTPEEVERRNRIRIAVWAYAYEIENDILVSDEQFDALALQIRPHMKTGTPRFDRFFAEHFDPSTGMWVHNHPDLDGLERYYHRLKKNQCLPKSSTCSQVPAPVSQQPPQPCSPK